MRFLRVLSRNLWAGPLSIALIAWGSQSHAVEPDSFRVATTRDFVTLCSAAPAEANYVAAIHFCHGFASGAFQYYQTLAAAEPEARYVCAPNPPPSRSEAIAGFVEWARRNPNHAADEPVDSLFRYLSERYPCTPATANR